MADTAPKSEEYKIFNTTFVMLDQYRRGTRTGDCSFLFMSIFNNPATETFLSQWSDPEFLEIIYRAAYVPIDSPLFSQQLRALTDKQQDRTAIALEYSLSTELQATCSDATIPALTP